MYTILWKAAFPLHGTVGVVWAYDVTCQFL